MLYTPSITVTEHENENDILKKKKNYGSTHFKLDVIQVAEGARARGASKIIGVDINPDKFIKGN